MTLVVTFSSEKKMNHFTIDNARNSLQKAVSVKTSLKIFYDPASSHGVARLAGLHWSFSRKSDGLGRLQSSSFFSMTRFGCVEEKIIGSSPKEAWRNHNWSFATLVCLLLSMQRPRPITCYTALYRAFIGCMPIAACFLDTIHIKPFATPYRSAYPSHATNTTGQPALDTFSRGRGARHLVYGNVSWLWCTRTVCIKEICLCSPRMASVQAFS